MVMVLEGAMAFVTVEPGQVTSGVLRLFYDSHDNAGVSIFGISIIGDKKCMAD